MNLKTIKYFLEKPSRIVPMLGATEHLNWMPDKLYLQLMALQAWGHRINFDNPRTFNEKLQWLKLYDRNPLYSRMVDKYEVRGYISEKLGEEYLIPLVGGPWNSVDEIDLDALPEQFVLKSTHDSGGVVICRDKASFDFEAAKRYLAKRLKRNFYWSGREWPYKNVQPRIIAEKYMVDESGTELKDYKVMCFNGEPKLIQVHRGRFVNHTQDFYDAQWKLQNITQYCATSDQPMEKPEFLEEMLQLCRVVTKGIPQVRSDWYHANGRMYFGELTFFDAAGFDDFQPEEWNTIIGDWIDLSLAYKDDK